MVLGGLVVVVAALLGRYILAAEGLALAIFLDLFDSFAHT